MTTSESQKRGLNKEIVSLGRSKSIVQPSGGYREVELVVSLYYIFVYMHVPGERCTGPGILSTSREILARLRIFCNFILSPFSLCFHIRSSWRICSSGRWKDDTSVRPSPSTPANSSELLTWWAMTLLTVWRNESLSSWGLATKMEWYVFMLKVVCLYAKSSMSLC